MEAANLVVSGASMVLSAAQNVFAALQCKELREICSLWGCESDLDSLQSTVNAIKSVLLDAEAKEVLSHQQLNFMQTLKDAVYKADDLLDHFTALAEQQQQRSLLKGGKVPKKVRLLFSRFGELGVARKMSKNVKRIRRELDAIATDASKFCFKVDYEPIRRRREETCSYVCEKSVIGRDKETEEIIKLLLAPAHGDFSVLAIVGMGGLGKTALAQLVYQHEQVTNEFQLKLWACVSDQDPDQLLLQPILAKILESATRQNQDGSRIEILQRQLREVLQGKKYLLVLDDVWNEDRHQWLALEDFLVGGGKGSRILVTTRSRRTTQIVGKIAPYELQGLSDENSWRLFERIAFEEQGQRERHTLVDIGKDIVKMCANVPLSIRVVGSLLYGQGKEKWVEFQQHGLSVLTHHENPIMRILKLSYFHLPPSLKSCFSYCTIFPKDTVIRKETLISLWLAQGYVEPLPGIQSIEDAGEEYFLILLRRCFFQDVKKDEFGEICSCKMHDLIHDMAKEVAGKEICRVNSTSSLDKRIRHVCDGGVCDCPESIFTDIGIRSFLGIHGRIRHRAYTPFPVTTLLAKWMRLRVLDLSHMDLQCLPEGISNLLHLRYLDVSENYNLKKLPDSITKLHYLQTLIIRGCPNLKELPKKFCRLVKLRVLDVENSGLTCMPLGMDKLSCLCRLNMFIVSERNSGSKQVSNLEVLRVLKDLKGHLTVKIKGEYKYVKGGSMEGGYMRNKEYLNDIRIEYEGRADGEEALLEDLEPHHNVKVLSLRGYGGVRIPTWGKEENVNAFLPNLVHVWLDKCKGLQELPALSRLQHLKYISLSGLEKLEYLEINRITSEPSSVAGPLFPSLVKLYLASLPNLRGWRGGSMSRVVSFPCLSKLVINDCPNLTSIPLCPTVDELVLCKFNERLRIMEEIKVEGPLASYVDTSTSSSLVLPLHWSSKNERHPELRVEIDNATYLKSLPMSTLRHLMQMTIMDNNEMERLSEVGEVLHASSSSLHSFWLINLPKLTSIFGGGGGVGLEHLTTLQTLQLDYLPSLGLGDKEKEEQGMLWRCLHRSLHHLYLGNLPKVVNLPKGMQHLTSLQSLSIEKVNLDALPEWIACLSSLQSLNIIGCKRIESLPISMQQLTSLTYLQIYKCSEWLHQRCQSPDGEDWPLIRHIVKIRNIKI